MIDRATVAEKLECYRMKPHPEECTDKDCPYNNNAPGIGYWCCYNRLLADAVALLRGPDLAKPKRESRAMLPCKCGCKRSEHWFAPGAEMPEELRCYQCGFTVHGKNQIDVIRQWNKAVKWNDTGKAD